MKSSALQVVAVITTFNPEINRFKMVLNSIIDQCVKIIVVDNHSSNLEEVLNSVLNSNLYDNIEVIRNDRNYGLGKALNEGIDLLRNNLEYFEYILTLDQDSIVCCSIKDVVGKSYSSYKNKNIGIININTRSSKYKEYFIEDNYPIISGSLINPIVFKSGLRYREEFFMDQIDFDFDYQVRKKGFKLLLTGFKGLEHKMGMKQDNKSESKLIEPPWRVYLLTRNSFVLLKENKISVTFFLIQLFIWFLKDLANNKRKLISTTFKYIIIWSFGIKDGIKNNFTNPEINKSIKSINSFKL